MILYIFFYINLNLSQICILVRYNHYNIFKIEISDFIKSIEMLEVNVLWVLKSENIIQK